MTQTAPSDDVATAAGTMWNASTTDAELWTAVAGWLAAPGRTPSDALELVDDIATLCAGTYAGPYALPPPSSGPAPSGPIGSFAWWAVQSYAAMVSNGSMAAGVTYLAAQGASGGTGAFRRDALTDLLRLAVGWHSGQQISSAPIPVVQGDSGPAWLNYIEDALSVAGTLAFAAPPVGPFIGAGLTSLGMLLSKLFPGSSSAPDFTGLITDLEEQFEEDEVRIAADGLKADGDWLASLYSIIDENQELSTGEIAPWLQTNVQQQLTPKLSGNTGTMQNLLTLLDYVELPGVVELAVYGISTYVALCRQQVVTDLALASVSQSGGQVDGCLEQLVSAALDFTRYQQAVLGVEGGPQQSYANWAAQLNSVLLRVGADRLSQITTPAGKDGGMDFGRGGTEYLMDYTYEDHGDPSAGTLTGSEASFVPTGQQPKPGWQQTCLLELITGGTPYSWWGYVASVAASLDSLYAGHFSCMSSWCTTMQGWAQMLPTLAPGWAPEVVDGRWTKTAPQGTVWAPGNQVRYAAASANEQGCSPPGPWGPAIPVTGQACPTLQLQPDPLGSASVDWVLRQVQVAGSQEFNGTVVVGAPTATGGITLFQDSDTTSLGSPPGAGRSPKPAAETASGG